MGDGMMLTCISTRTNEIIFSDSLLRHFRQLLLRCLIMPFGYYLLHPCSRAALQRTRSINQKYSITSDRVLNLLKEHTNSIKAKRIYYQFLLVAIFLLCSLHLHARAPFQLFEHQWSPALIQKLDNGWQHVYLCQSCPLTPSLTIHTTLNPATDQSFFHELERSFAQVIIQDEYTDAFRRFTLLRAIRSLDPYGPEELTVITTRIPSSTGKHWHHIQAIIEKESGDKEHLIENNWINLLSRAKSENNALILPTEQAQTIIDLSSPDHTWFQTFAEKTGLNHPFLTSNAQTAATTGLIIIGAQLALGIAGVRGPCGKPLHQCPCTNKAKKLICPTLG